MAIENKDKLRNELNEEDLLNVAGGGSPEGGDTNYWYEVCGQCGKTIRCSKTCSLEDHMKKFCSAKQ